MKRVSSDRHWLVTGASGMLGAELCRVLMKSGHRVTGLVHRHCVDIPGVDEISCDLLDVKALAAIMAEHAADVVVHAAGLTNVDRCESDEAAAYHVHSTTARIIAEACAGADRKMVYISTDQLWDGTKAMVAESEPLRPINAYGRSKAAGESAVLESDSRTLVIRTNFFGPGRLWHQSLSDWMIDALRRGEALSAFDDVHFTPINLKDFVPLIMALVALDARGVYHVGGRDRISKYDFAVNLCARMNLPAERIRPISIFDAGLVAPRPRDMSLNTAKAAQLIGREMPTFIDGLDALRLCPANQKSRN